VQYGAIDISLCNRRKISGIEFRERIVNRKRRSEKNHGCHV
jgi:hypothetical protein